MPKIKMGPERGGGRAHTPRALPRAQKRQSSVPDGRQRVDGRGVGGDVLVHVSRYHVAPRTSPLDNKLRLSGQAPL